MSESHYRSRIKQLGGEVTRLQNSENSEAKKIVNLDRQILNIRNGINKYTSASSLKSKFQQIDRLSSEQSKAREKQTNLSIQRARKMQELSSYQEKLRSLELKEQKKQQEALQKRDSELKKQQDSYRKREQELQKKINRLTTESFTSQLVASIYSQPLIYPPKNTRPDFPSLVRPEIFIIESEEHSIQGTCCHVSGIGLVTCQHTLAEDSHIFPASKFTKKIPVRVLASNAAIDMAIIDAPGLDLGRGLVLGSADSLSEMDEIILAGFPNYQDGDSGLIKSGSVAGYRTVSTIRRLLIDTRIFAGNSGSPVLNSRGEIIGIAVTGDDRMEGVGETENHGVIPIDAIAHLGINL